MDLPALVDHGALMDLPALMNLPALVDHGALMDLAAMEELAALGEHAPLVDLAEFVQQLHLVHELQREVLSQEPGLKAAVGFPVSQSPGLA